MEDKAFNKTPRDILRIAFRHRYLFLVSAVLTATAALLWALPTPVKYTSTCTFERTMPIADVAQGQLTAMAERLNQTLRLSIADKAFIKSAMRDLGMLAGFERSADTGEAGLTQQEQFRLQDYVRDVQSRVGVRVVVTGPKLHIVQVSFTDEDNRTAQKMANTLVQKYISRTYEGVELTVDTETEQLRRTLEEYKKKRNSLYDQKDKMEADVDVGQFKFPESRAELNDRILIHEDLLAQAQAELSVAENKRKGLIGEMERYKEAIEQKVQKQWGPNPRYEQAKEDLRQMEENLVVLRTQRRMTDSHPAVKALVKQIEAKRVQLANTPERIVVQEVEMPEEVPEALVYQIEEAKAEEQRKLAEVERLQQTKDKLVKVRANFGEVQSDYWALTEELASLEGLIDQNQIQLIKFEQARQAVLAERGIKLNIRELAELQEKPSSPQKMKVLGLAGAAAIAVGAGLVFLVHFFDRTISTPDDAVKHFGVPVHGVIGEIVTPKERVLRLTTGWFLKITIGVVLLFVLALSYKAVDWKLEEPPTYQKFVSSPTTFVIDKVMNVPNKIERIFGGKDGKASSPSSTDAGGT